MLCAQLLGKMKTANVAGVLWGGEGEDREVTGSRWLVSLEELRCVESDRLAPRMGQALPWVAGWEKREA